MANNRQNQGSGWIAVYFDHDYPPINGFNNRLEFDINIDFVLILRVLIGIAVVKMPDSNFVETLKGFDLPAKPTLRVGYKVLRCHRITRLRRTLAGGILRNGIFCIDK